jgi:hypothetical protein
LMKHRSWPHWSRNCHTSSSTWLHCHHCKPVKGRLRNPGQVSAAVYRPLHTHCTPTTLCGPHHIWSPPKAQAHAHTSTPPKRAPPSPGLGSSKRVVAAHDVTAARHPHSVG